MGEYADYWGHQEWGRCWTCRGTGKTVTGYLPTGVALTDGSPCRDCQGRGMVEVQPLAALDGGSDG